jgi:hypothetical protein
VDEAFDQSASKRALLALKITAVKVFNVGFWVTPGCWRDGVLGGWIVVAGMAGWRL